MRAGGRAKRAIALSITNFPREREREKETQQKNRGIVVQLIRRPDTLHAEHFKERKESHTAHGKAKLDEWEEIEKKEK